MTPTANTPGYSGTPLAKKLGIEPNARVFTIAAPADYASLLAPLPSSVAFTDEPDQGTDLAHVFVTGQSTLVAHLETLRATLKPDTPVWVSWPKKSSKVPTTVTEDSIRAAALPLGYVDIKVCAVSDVWSGLKLVVRRTLRA